MTMMYLVRFNTKTYHFHSKLEAMGFAKTWGLQVEETTEGNVRHYLVSKHSHALDTVANLHSQAAVIELIKTYDVEWYDSAFC